MKNNILLSGLDPIDRIKLKNAFFLKQAKKKIDEATKKRIRNFKLT